MTTPTYDAMVGVLDTLDPDFFQTPEAVMFDEEFLRDPFTPFREMRERFGNVFDSAEAAAAGYEIPNPFMLDDEQPIYYVLGYDAALEALQNGGVFSNAGYANSVELIFGPSVTTQDGETHQLYRKLLQSSFRRSVVDRWAAELVLPVTAYLVDRIRSQGRADLVRDLTAPLPFAVTSRMLGLPETEFKRFFHLATDLLHIAYDMPKAFAAKEELDGFLREQIEDRRTRPTEDMISLMVHAEVDGHQLPDDLIVANLIQLLPAGIETTFRSTANMLVQLLRHPEQFDAVRADRSLVPAAAEESLRLEGPAFGVPRVATAETVLGGVEIPAGAGVMVSQAMANRDGGRWERPEQYDLHRAARPHMAFIVGPHTCLGMHLARLQMHAVLGAVCDSLPDLRIDRDAPEAVTMGYMLRSPAHCPVTFTAS